jgi:hypothetical protein
LEVPEAASGTVGGELRLTGTMSRPQAEARLFWTGRQSSPLLGRLGLRAVLDEGVVEATIDDAATAAGTFGGRAVIPLGGLPKPEWLWPGAPGGALRAEARVSGFRSGPLLEVLDVADPGAEVEAELRVELEADPRNLTKPSVRLEVREFRVRQQAGDVVAEGPIVATLDGSRIEVTPFVLVGLGSRIEAEAVYKPGSRDVVASLRSTVGPDLARLMPLPVFLRGPLSVDAEIRIPATGGSAFADARGTVTIDHGDGSLVMRDPPVEIRGLRLVARLERGAVDIVDGRAEVNRGAVEIGGGWDPRVGQGLVLEIDDVTFLTEGILTKWDGQLAVEPDADRLARVVGDLDLVAGLWEEPFAITGALVGGEELELASDDPLYDIALDLDVRGRAGIRVDNNLGRFDASWDVIRVGGTAAWPRLRGEVRIAAGGVLDIGGQTVTVRRGSVRFTGDPSVDPLLEIVPESDLTLVGSGDESGFDPSSAARMGLARGLTSALGLENTTVRLADIAVQTEKDPSSRFMVATSPCFWPPTSPTCRTGPRCSRRGTSAA